jgi:catechol 2,3-dioxygenase-like lactoylglutathione lyase family enzyme
MRVVGLHHAQISIPVGSENAARAFYCGVLGLREIEKPANLAGRGGLWLAVGTFNVHLGVEDGVDRAATRAHLAYEVTNLPAWRDKLGAAGVDLLRSVPLPGYERFEFRDPFGNRVELIESASSAG